VQRRFWRVIVQVSLLAPLLARFWRVLFSSFVFFEQGNVYDRSDGFPLLPVAHAFLCMRSGALLGSTKQWR